jgi:cytochrome c-type biogenesis protein CcmH
VFELLRKAGAVRLLVAAALVALVAATAIALLVRSRAETETPMGEAPLAWTQAANGGSEPRALVRRLSEHVEKQPHDARAWVILARLQFEMEHFIDAAHAYEKALSLPSKVANDAAVWCEYADALGMTQGGKLAGKPRALIDRALALKPNHPKALEMAGSAEYERGDYAAALDYWRPLLAALDPGSQAHPELASAIDRAERLASIQGRR